MPKCATSHMLDPELTDFASDGSEIPAAMRSMETPPEDLDALQEVAPISYSRKNLCQRPASPFNAYLASGETPRSKGGCLCT